MSLVWNNLVGLCLILKEQEYSLVVEQLAWIVSKVQMWQTEESNHLQMSNCFWKGVAVEWEPPEKTLSRKDGDKSHSKEIMIFVFVLFCFPSEEHGITEDQMCEMKLTVPRKDMNN